jgi:outer membrane lipoprotein SlyB
MTIETSPGATPKQPSRTVWLAGGALAIASLAAAAGIAMRPGGLGGKPASEPKVEASSQTSQTPREATKHAAVAPAAAPASVCKSCGVVESVRAVTHKGQASGLGAVAGGVLGAAVGNQMGQGNGRAAMTVLGAVGGGVAGNEIEKRSKSETVYEVRVRLDDGTTRTIEQRSAPAAGTRVVIEGNNLRVSGAARHEG